MRYNDTVSQSGEYLRLAIPLLTRHAMAANPVNYAVWYEYVAGRNDVLVQEIENLLKQNAKLNETQLAALYQKHVSEFDAEGMKKLSLEMRQLIVSIADMATHSGAEAQKFSHALTDRVQRFNSGEMSVEALRDVISGLLADTTAMRDSITAIQGQLLESKSKAEKLGHELKRVREEVVTDMLTGLLNRKGFSQALDSETVRVSESRNLSLLMIDIDHFKQVNDTYGHLLGDKVIRFVGMTVKDRIKGKDIAARYGGEELAVLLPETSLAGARSVAEEIRRAVATARIQRLDNGQAIGAITVSLGVAQYRPGETHEALIARADAALYRSKESGRNRVSVEGD